MKGKITCNRCMIWSWIRETRGEITKVMPGHTWAGSYKKPAFTAHQRQVYRLLNGLELQSDK